MILSNAKRAFPVWRILSLLLAIALIFAIIFPFAKGKPSRKTQAMLFCDMEKLGEEGDRKVFEGKNIVFLHGETQSSRFARSGKYSSAINKELEFGVSIEDYPVEPGATYEISIWRKSEASTGLLVVDCNWGFYKSESIPSEQSDGWERITVTTKVPIGKENPKIKAYAWNPDALPAYFDDFSIIQASKGERYEMPDFDPAKIEIINLNVSENGMEKLENTRMEAMRLGLLVDKDQVIRTRMETPNGNLKGTLRLKGDWTDHLQGDKWSFRLQLDPGYTWHRMTTFSFQNPNTRSFLNEWVYHQFLNSEDIITPRYDFINLKINQKNLGVYAWEEHFAKQMIEYNKRREGPIVKFNESGFWEIMKMESESVVHLEPLVPIVESADVDAFGMKSIMKDSVAYGQFKTAETLLNQYKNAEKKPSEVFDLDKMAKYYAIADVFRAHHSLIWHNQRMYYNPVISKLEPIGFDAYTPAGPLDWLQRPFTGHGRNPRYFSNTYWTQMMDNLFADEAFLEKYVGYLYHYSNDQFIKRFLLGREDEIKKRELLIQEEFSDYSYDWAFLPYSARRVRAAMLPRPNTSIVAHFKGKTASGYQYEVANYHCLPLKLLGVGKENCTITSPFSEEVTVGAYPEEKIPELRLVESAGKDDWIIFKIPGLDSLFSAPLSAWESPQVSTPRQDLFQIPNPVDCQYYTVSGKNIYFRKGVHRISSLMILPAGYVLHFSSGTTLDLVNKGGVISRSRVNMLGTEENPVVIKSSDKTGQGFTVLQADSISQLSYVIFDNLNTLSYKGWNLTGATNFYESEVEMENCRFQNNHCEDALNIVRSKFLMRSCLVAFTAFDGFDCDFCKGTVDQSRFYRTGNDGMDFSGSNIYIKRALVEETGDKGISVGEESEVIIESATIRNVKLGLASKDLSIVRIKDITLENIDQGFSCYQKKPEYGGGTIVVGAYKATGVKQMFYLQPGSQITIDDKTIKGTE